MAQNDYNIPNQSFPSFRSDLNDALSAINTSNSGTSRPSSAVAGTIWLDLSGGVTAYALKFFDGSDDITLANINTTANTVDFVDSSVASDLLNDTSPQLGNNLDVLAREIFTSTTNGNIKLTPDGTGLIEVKGATNPGSIQLNCESNSHGIKLTSPPHSSGQSYELKFPTGNVTAGKVLKVDSISGSGATAVGQLTFGDVSGGTSWQSSVKTANFTASAGEGYFVNTSGGAFEIDLPSSPSVGDQIEFVDFARNFGTAALTLDQGSVKFQGSATSPKPVYDTDGQSIKIVYSGSTQGWIPLTDDDVTFETLQNYSASYLVVAGGGGGGYGAAGGGGGAGGYRTNYGGSAVTLNGGTVYTITIGAGAASITSGSEANGANGSDSVLSGSGITTITSSGGGGGGYHGQNGLDGGSGGGAGNNSSASPNKVGGSGNTPSVSPSQGNNGGASFGEHIAAGGGGAGAVGGNSNTGSNSGGAAGGGGAGTANAITGSSVTYAGGGGGSTDGRYPVSAGSAGSGGGGAANHQTAGSNGSANTGGGGGGGGTSPYPNSVKQNTGAGGSGVVILRVPTSSYSGTVSGSPTVTTDGSDKVIKFTGSGSYTA